MPRPSPIRDAVASLLGDGDSHGYSLEELTRALGEQGIGADFSSVYRAVRRLEREGSARKVELGDGLARYEGPGKHHDHVVCDACGAVAGVVGCPIDDTVKGVETVTGYEIKRHRLVFVGICSRCASGG
jgi:Fe2+ or Zn2+ uptake regulation protein